MEHIYTIKVKRQFDPRGLYPSERRYSASTVFGLAWLHLALAATAFLLACLALVNPNPTALLSKENDMHFQTNFLLNEMKNQNTHFKDSEEHINATNLDNDNLRQEVDEAQSLNQQKEANEMSEEFLNNNVNVQYSETREDSTKYPVTLILAPTLLTIGALAAGLAAILASRKWYVDQNIMWFFLSSILAAIFSIVSLCMIVTWIVSASENGLSFCDYFSDGNLFGKVKIVNNVDEDSHEGNLSQLNNHSWFYIIKVPVDELQAKNIPLLGEESKQSRTRKVLSINILIASVVETLWSFLSLRVAWKGMRADYPEDDSVDNRRGGTVQVVTELKGNNTKHLPKNTKILPPQPDLIEHYPKDNKIRKFFQSQQENGGFFLKANQNENGFMVLGANDVKSSEFPRRENSAEYKERIFNFLNRCSAEQSEIHSEIDPGSLTDPINSNPSGKSEDFHADRSYASVTVETPNNVPTDRVSIASWGDSHDYPIYDQNTLDFNKIMLNFDRRKPVTQDANKEEMVKTDMGEIEALPTEVEEPDTTNRQPNQEK